jgi:hypothetical protein
MKSRTPLGDPAFQLAGVVGVVTLAAYTLISIVVGAGFAIPVGIVGSVGLTIVLRGPVGAALADRLHAGVAEAAPPEELLAELDELRGRMVELEERVDFTERLLTKAREAAALPGGGLAQ